MTVVALIPARGGSKRVPGKNIAHCAGKPLLAWTAEAVLASRRVERAILSTDDEEIAALGRSLGLDVPFLRPPDISGDTVPMVPVMQHALGWAQDNGIAVSAQVLLQPTSPLRRAEHIDEAVDRLFDTGAETVVSVMALSHISHPRVCYRIESDRLTPFLPPGLEIPGDQAYSRNGPAVLINRPAVIERGERFGDPLVPYVMAAEDSVDIDEPFDLALAEFLLQRRAQAEGESRP